MGVLVTWTLAAIGWFVLNALAVTLTRPRTQYRPVRPTCAATGSDQVAGGTGCQAERGPLDHHAFSAGAAVVRKSRPLSSMA